MQQSKSPPASPPADSARSPAPPKASPKSPSQPAPPPAPPFHPEIRSIVSLTVAHAHKIYFSGPLIRRIERQPDGQKPTKDEGWTEVWAQLGGTILSIWDMKQIQEASRLGKEVPPTYINVTDAFVQVLGSVTVPATPAHPSKRYTNVLTLNTAGSNLLLFSCPSTAALISWASALRVSSWEKSRLEEIYTAHLIRITLSRPDLPTTLVRGKLEGWVRIRIAGQTDWKRVWMVIKAGHEMVGPEQPTNGSVSAQTRKKRMSNLFSRDQSPPRQTGPSKASITMYAGSKPRERKKAWLTLHEVTQAFAVYPERPELIPRSTLIKLEGLLGDEELAQSMKSREGWLLFMPELEGSSMNHATEMLKWVIAIHDAFELYGRPNAWTWDPREPKSLMFAYPVGPQRELLFLDREVGESLDPRDDRTSAIRSKLLELLMDRMRQQQPQLVQQGSARRTSSDQPPTLPPLSMSGGPSNQNGNAGQAGGPQLPPLNFNEQEARMLTPITEGDSIMTHGRNMSMDTGTITSAAVDLSAPDKPILDGESYTSSSRSAGGSTPATLRHQQSLTTPWPPPQSPTPRASTSPPASSQSNTQSQTHSTKTEVPSRPESVEDAVKSSPNDTAATTPTTTFSSKEKEKGVASGGLDSNLMARTKSFGGASVLSSPYSPVEDNVSILTSPHSLHDREDQNKNNRDYQTFGKVSANLQAVGTPPPPAHVEVPAVSPVNTNTGSSSRHASTRKIPSQSTHEPEDHFLNEAGALFLMHQSRMESNGDAAVGIKPSSIPRQVPMPTSSDEEDSNESDDDSGEYKKPVADTNTSANVPVTSNVSNSRSPPLRQGTPMAFVERPNQPSRSNSSNTTSSLPAVSNPTISPRIPKSTSPKSFTGRSQGSRSPQPQSVAPLKINHNSSPSLKGDRMNAVAGNASGSAASSMLSSRVGLGRKPSGARAPTSSRVPLNSTSLSSSHQLTEEVDQLYEDQNMPAALSSAIPPNPHPPLQVRGSSSSSGGLVGTNVSVALPSPAQPKPEFVKDYEGDVESANDDVLAAISYLSVADEQTRQVSATSNGESSGSSQQRGVEGDNAASSESVPTIQYRSSFAPSTSAAKRKAKAQAQQAAHHAAQHKPGRANGQRSKTAGTWNDSSDEEEEEEEEEEEDDGDSDVEVVPPRMRGSPSGNSPIVAPTRPSVYGQFAPEGQGQAHLRAPRTLPQPPPLRTSGMDEHLGQGRRSDMMGDPRRTFYDEVTQIRSQSEFPHPGAARNTVWSQVLDPGRNVNPTEQTNTRDTFVQLEPAETMTKAFTPQGLLSAGIQDKQDRSAKRQEELARETGASLINVPNKPPPPQTGLLGAITAHERERKREGGVGAALTEREREKRLAEERQRRYDEQQRQQMEQMQQGGSMYGNGGYGYNPMMNPMMMGMNPMMMNPMMTGGGMSPMMTGGGMNPMMTGGGMMGYPPMLSPQQMFAAQQAAAAAYQQAMMAFSNAGSQVGGENNGNPQGTTMPGFDPRMSMMGMPPMMGGGMGMGMGMGMMSPTMTGNFDSRFPPGATSPNGTGDGSLLPPTGLGQHSSRNSSPRNSSPVMRGSPLARPAEGSERSATPKH